MQRTARFRALGILVIALAFVACGSTSTSSGAPSATNGCGAGYAGANAGVWIEGSGASSACSQVITAIRSGGNQPVSWDGSLGAVAGYEAVCSDQLSSMSYEVVDTGAHILGTQLCQYMTTQFGASSTATAPDLFGIVATADGKAQAAQQAQSSAQAEANDQAAVDQGASAVQSDISSVASDAATAALGPPSLASDVLQAQKDLAVTAADLKIVENEGSGNLSCGADAGTVAADAGGVQADLGGIEADQGGQTASDSSVTGDESRLASDWQQLQSAEAAVPTYQPGNLPTQDQIAAAEKSGTSLLAKGDQAVAAALSKVQGYVNQANADASKASSICGG
jgi:hypothetical protein